MRDETQRILVEYEKTIDKNLNVIEQGKFLVDGLAGVSDTSRVGITQADIIVLEQQGTPLDRTIQSRIDDYIPMTENIDTRLVTIANSISTIKAEIVSLVSQAVGTSTVSTCGTPTGICSAWAGGISTCLAGYGQVLGDAFQVRVQNMSSRSYVNIDPQDYVTNTLSSGNVGIGSFNILSKDGGAGVGYTVSLKTTGSNTVGACSTYHAAVTSKYAQIDALRSEADTLISTINVAKRERSSLQYERWAILYSNDQASQENTRLRTTAANIQSTTLEPYV
jgi:hypothetical protein